jgi:hypothetical protein
VLDSERFNLLRTLDFFSSFGDVELWEVVHRAKWQRFHFGHALYRKGEEGNTSTSSRRARSRSSATARGRAARRGTSVGEMAYLAPSPELQAPQHRRDRHRTGDDDLVHARHAGAGQPGCRTCSTRRSSACWCGACMRARGAGAPARIL